MEPSTKLTVPHDVAFCKGRACDDLTACGNAGCCLYKSSAELVREIKDFDGRVTGGGIKGSMTDPSKIPLALIDPTFTEGVGRVLRHGAKKYAPGNWLNGMKWSEVIAGILRHLTAIQRGEDIDAETGEMHAYHASCGLMFLARYQTDARYAALDDRMFKAAL